MSVNTNHAAILKKVLSYLGKEARTVNLETGIDEGMLSKVKNSKASCGKGIRRRLQDVYGISESIWDAPLDAPVARFVVGSGASTTPIVQDYAYVCARIAADRDEPDAMISELLRIKSPTDTFEWWLNVYLDLHEKYCEPRSGREPQSGALDREGDE